MIDRVEIDERDRDTFRRGYRTAIIWADTYHYTADDLDKPECTDGPDWCDAELSPETRGALNQQADDFLDDQEVARLLSPVCGDILNPYDWGDAGQDFALTRNGHGAGFWDRGLDDGEELSSLARTYGFASLDAVREDSPHTWEVMEG